MKKIALSLVLLSLAMPLARAQSDNTIHVKTFGGVDVGSKIANAMATCPAAPIPCILTVDASLAAFPAGTTPSLCTNCYLQDFRNGPATGPNSAIAVDALQKYRHVDTCSQSGSDWGARAANAVSFCIAEGWTGCSIDASCEPHNPANLVGGNIVLNTSTNPFGPVITLCGVVNACTLFSETLLLSPGVWNTNVSLVLPSLSTLDGQSSMGTPTANPATTGGTVLAEGASFPAGTPLIQYGFATGTTGAVIAQAVHVQNLSLWGGGGGVVAGNDALYNAFCQDRCTAQNVMMEGFYNCLDLESETSLGGAMNSGPWSPFQCDLEGSTAAAGGVVVGATPLNGSQSMGAAPIDLGPRLEFIGSGNGVLPTSAALDIESGTVNAGEIYVESWNKGVLVNSLHGTFGSSVNINLLLCNASKYAFFACLVPNNGGNASNAPVGGVHVGAIEASGATFNVLDNCGACGVVRIPNAAPKLSYGAYTRAGYNVQRSDITAVLHSYFNCSTGAAPAMYELETLNSGCLNTIGSSQTTGIVGILVSGQDQFAAHRSFVASGGTFPCDFGPAATTTAGDYVTVASGKCSDNGTTIPTTAFRGIVQQTEAPGTYATPTVPGCSAHTGGATVWSYKVTTGSQLDASESAGSVACTISTGTAVLTANNFNSITALTCSTANPCNIYEIAPVAGWIGTSIGSSFTDIGYQPDTSRTAPTAIRIAPQVDILGTL